MHGSTEIGGGFCRLTFCAFALAEPHANDRPDGCEDRHAQHGGPAQRLQRGKKAAHGNVSRNRCATRRSDED